MILVIFLGVLVLAFVASERRWRRVAARERRLAQAGRLGLPAPPGELALACGARVTVLPGDRHVGAIERDRPPAMPMPGPPMRVLG